VTILRQIFNKARFVGFDWLNVRRTGRRGSLIAFRPGGARSSVAVHVGQGAPVGPFIVPLKLPWVVPFQRFPYFLTGGLGARHPEGLEGFCPRLALTLLTTLQAVDNPGQIQGFAELAGDHNVLSHHLAAMGTRGEHSAQSAGCIKRLFGCEGFGTQGSAPVTPGGLSPLL